MERVAFRSKDIALVGYDDEDNTLELAFRSGCVYHYRAVPKNIHETFLSAPSLGIFFRDHIREVYSCEKVS